MARLRLSTNGIIGMERNGVRPRFALLDTHLGGSYCLACRAVARPSAGADCRARGALFSRDMLPMETTSRLTLSQHKDIAVVELNDTKILDEMNISEIGHALTALIGAKERPKMLLDFTHVEYLSSAALGMLINVNERIKQRNGQLRLANIRPQIKEVFDITKLNRLFRLCEGRQNALESFE